MRLPTSDMLDAYRADLENAGKSEFAATDTTWLRFGVLLQRAVSVPMEHRAEYLSAGVSSIVRETGPNDGIAGLERLAHATGGGDDASDALCAAVMAVANDAEDAGAFAVATAMLDSGRALVGLAQFRLQGRLIAQQARIFRKIGEFEMALELYDEVASIAAAHDDVELDARARVGRGTVARMRGNYPEARREFLAVIELTPTNDVLRELQVRGHHMLLVASAVAGDFETALRHGQRALEGARGSDHRAELLMNLASVCYDIGEYRAALNGHLEALGQTRLPRVRLTALGSAAVAAGRLEEHQMVRDLVGAGMQLMTAGGHEYEIVDMLREFAEAYDSLGDDQQAARFRTEALQRARRGRFFEIVHRLEHPPRERRVVTSPDRLAPDAMEVATQLASGDTEELMASAINSDHWYSNTR